MTKSAKAVLICLNRYVGSHPSRREDLKKFYQEHAKKRLYSWNLSRHLSTKFEPNMSTTLIYIFYLYREGQLTPGKPGQGVFIFTNPDILK